MTANRKKIYSISRKHQVIITIILILTWLCNQQSHSKEVALPYRKISSSTPRLILSILIPKWVSQWPLLWHLEKSSARREIWTEWYSWVPWPSTVSSRWHVMSARLATSASNNTETQICMNHSSWASLRRQCWKKNYLTQVAKMRGRGYCIRIKRDGFRSQLI
jgi:hypothetical protein